MAKKDALGKGLSALISEDSSLQQDHSYIPNLPVDQIKPNPQQPRIEIRPESLLELADSIRENGIVEPLIVTQKGDKEFELIVGERRWRAAKLAGLKKVPAVIKEASPRQMLELAIVENIQRADLNPLEEALAFKQLAIKYKMSHTQIAKKVGVSRPAVVNKIRLLKLPKNIKEGLLKGKISEGHARALLGLTSDQAIIAAFRKIINEKLSVRAVEELVRRLNASRIRKEFPPAPSQKRDHTVEKYEKDLQKIFGKKLRITKSTRGGRIIVPFDTDVDLEEVYKKLIS